LRRNLKRGRLVSLFDFTAAPVIHPVITTPLIATSIETIIVAGRSRRRYYNAVDKSRAIVADQNSLRVTIAHHSSRMLP
jgi:hypothetical protein